MSTEEVPTKEDGEHGQPAAAHKQQASKTTAGCGQDVPGGEVLDSTPRNESPPSFNVMTPGTVEVLAQPTGDQLASQQEHEQHQQHQQHQQEQEHLPTEHRVDYFTPPSTTVSSSLLAPSTAHDLAHTSPSPSHAPAPALTASISTSDATASGHILLLTDSQSTSLHSLARPPPHTAISSLSVDSADSSVTVTPHLAQPTSQPFPNQAFSALHNQQHPTPYRPFPARRGTQPPGISTWASTIASLHSSGIRSASQSPAISSHTALFSAGGLPPTPAPASSNGSGTYASPYLHFTHRHEPKETHIADVDVDPVSGRKLINHYEIIDELGRGTHGKVKLGRDLESPANDPIFVAIKIVERFSKRRKLGRLGTTEDKVKKEVAILKKARHPNIVALLEVIDDPSRKKVYIVLEWLERGEIDWRVKGPKEIAMVEARRYEREKKHSSSEISYPEDLAVLAEAQKRLARQKKRLVREYKLRKHGQADIPEAWSIEMAGDTDSEESEDDRLSRISSLTAHTDTGKFTVEQGGRPPSRTPSMLHPSDSGDMLAPQPPHEWEISSSTPSERDHHEIRRPSSAFSMTGLEGTMYGPYDLLSSQTSRVASLNSLTSSRGSIENTARHSAEILDSHLDSELEYVPVMTMEQIRVAFRDTLLGLQYLHYQGIVHRDIKPPNLLATSDNRVKISDFGVSYLGRPVHDGEQEDVSEAEAQDLDDEAKELAKTVGTPAFYAPELCITDTSEDHMPVTKAIDVWALGVTLFCMLFARTPFVDNEYVVMRQIADEEIYLPRRRLQPVDSKPQSRPNSHSRAFPPKPTGRRHKLDIVYEEINDELHDLLRRLLCKDPRKRITLEEVRHHPWVLSDLSNKMKWLEETDPYKQAEGRKIEVSREELNTAVVPLNLVERVRSGLKKVLRSTGITRNRAQSNVGSGGSNTSKDGSPGPSGSQHEDRRKSLLGDDTVFMALKATHSRDGGHPLSKSVAASPDYNKSYEDHHRRYDSSYSDHDLTNDLTRTLSRPEPPHRANTIASTAESIRTVKQSDYRSGISGETPPPSPGLPSTPLTQLQGGRGLSGLLGGTSNLIKTVRERSANRSKHRRGPSSERGSVDSSDAHGEATLAISQATAAGHVNVHDSLKTTRLVSTASNSPASSRPHSLMSDSQTIHTQSQHLHSADQDAISRLSSTSSMSSVSYLKSKMSGTKLGQDTPPQLAQTSAEDWKRLDEERVRKLQRQGLEEDSGRAASRNDSAADEETPCPTSPDDMPSRDYHFRVPSIPTSSNPDTPPISTSPVNFTGFLPSALESSSSDLGSAVSMSISNPSIPSVISEASSVDLYDYSTYTTGQGDKRETASDDTLSAESEQQHVDEVMKDGSNPDQEAAHDSEDDEFDSSSDSDGGLVMRRKSANKGHGLIVSQLDTNKERRGPGISRRSMKSSRSGSNNTMKKVQRWDGADERHSPEIREE